MGFPDSSILNGPMLQIESWVPTVRAEDLDHGERLERDPEHGVIRFAGPLHFGAANRHHKLKARCMIGAARKDEPERKEGT